MSWIINITDSSNATTGVSVGCDDYHEGVIFSTSITLVFVFGGFPGAVAVLLDMFQKGRKGTPFTSHDIFMLNLTIMDAVYLLSLLPQVFNYLHWNNAAFEVFISFMFSFHLCGRPFFLSCISLDCYVAMVHPVTYRARKGLTPRILMSVGVWIVTIACGYYFAVKHDGNLLNFNPVLSFTLTLPIIGFCDLSILWTLQRSKPGRGDVHPQKKKALQIITNNLIVTFISYFPPAVALLVSRFLSLNGNAILCLLAIPMLCITVVGNAVSPILHLNNLGKLDWLKCWEQK